MNTATETIPFLISSAVDLYEPTGDGRPTTGCACIVAVGLAPR
jgi:hypothetical protein